MQAGCLGGIVEILGLPGRPGVATGRVSVVLAAEPLDAGVAVFADPSVFVGTLERLTATRVGGEGFVGDILSDLAADASLASAVGIPVVLGLDTDLFRTGERVAIDGGRGVVELAGVEPVRVVTVFLSRADGRILLMRRSDQVGSFRGRWAAVSGFLEEVAPVEQARREVREEVGFDLG